MKLTEKAAYLKGLADGLEYDKTTKEGKLIAALIELTEALADKVEGLDHDLEELNDYVEELDEDLGEVEDFLDDEGDEEECDGECDDCDYADETYEVECPTCGEKICFDESVDPANLTCPSCGAKFSCNPDDEEKK